MPISKKIIIIIIIVIQHCISYVDLCVYKVQKYTYKSKIKQRCRPDMTITRGCQLRLWLFRYIICY